MTSHLEASRPGGARTTDRPPLRFAVLCAGTTFPAWQAGCLHRLLESGEAVPVLLIGSEAGDGSDRSWRRPVGGFMWRAYERSWVARRSRAMRPVDLAASFAAVPRIDSPDAEQIQRYGLDFILRFGPGKAPEGFPRLARYGVWSFGEGDAVGHGASPAGFWEVYRGIPVTRIRLVRDTELPDAGIVLREGVFRTHGSSYVRNFDAVHLGSADLPVRVCRSVRAGDMPGLSNGPSPAPRAVLGGLPSNRHMAAFGLRFVWRAMKRRTRNLLLAEQWNVGIADAPIHAFLTPGSRPEIRWLPDLGRMRFVADPFGVMREGRLTVVMEEWDHRAQRGHIVAVDYDGDGVEAEPGPAMRFPFHLSYPFLVEHGGDLYCVPESAEVRRVDLYRATAFPREWVKVTSLVEGFAAKDPTLFRHGDRWWLFCGGSRLASAELHAWHAPDLLGPWRPHPGNPLKVDIRSSRPAGTPFVHSGRLYRPAQDSTRTYGGAVAINRVLRLTPTEFEEELVRVVQPYGDSPYRDGLHTLSAVGDVTLVDAKRKVFVWSTFGRRLRSKLPNRRPQGSRRALPEEEVAR